MNDDWSQQFKDLLSSPLGAELIRTLREDVHNTLLDKAEGDNTPEDERLRLLNNASGVTKAIAHLNFRSDTGQREQVTPTDEGGKK